MKHAKIFTELANRIDPNISMLDAAMDMIAKLRAVIEGFEGFVVKQESVPDGNLKQTPLTEKQIRQCLFQSGCYDNVRMSIDTGPYSITRPTQKAESFVRAIEKLHGIGVGA